MCKELVFCVRNVEADEFESGKYFQQIFDQNDHSNFFSEK